MKPDHPRRAFGFGAKVEIRLPSIRVRHALSIGVRYSGLTPSSVETSAGIFLPRGGGEGAGGGQVGTQDEGHKKNLLCAL